MVLFGSPFSLPWNHEKCLLLSGSKSSQMLSMLSVCTLLSTATIETPHERFFKFHRKASHGCAVPSWLTTQEKFIWNDLCGQNTILWLMKWNCWKQTPTIHMFIFLMVESTVYTSSSSLLPLWFSSGRFSCCHTLLAQPFWQGWLRQHLWFWESNFSYGRTDPWSCASSQWLLLSFPCLLTSSPTPLLYKSNSSCVQTTIVHLGSAVLFSDMAFLCVSFSLSALSLLLNGGDFGEIRYYFILYIVYCINVIQIYSILFQTTLYYLG